MSRLRFIRITKYNGYLDSMFDGFWHFLGVPSPFPCPSWPKDQPGQGDGEVGLSPVALFCCLHASPLQHLGAEGSALVSNRSSNNGSIPHANLGGAGFT